MGTDKPPRTRLSVSVTQPFVDGVNELVKDGFYLNSGDVIRESLKLIFEKHGLKPFKKHKQML